MPGQSPGDEIKGAPALICQFQVPRAHTPDEGRHGPVFAWQKRLGAQPGLCDRLAMRYVIVIAAVAFFLIWDGLYNQGRYLDMTVRNVSHVVRYVTGKA